MKCSVTFVTEFVNIDVQTMFMDVYVYSIVNTHLYQCSGAHLPASARDTGFDPCS